MKVIQINTKSKSPKIDLNNINRIINNKSKNSSKNSKITKTRNNDYLSNKSKNKYIFKRLFSHNNCLHFSSNNCTSTNTTNFNNSKTNNFIILENDFNSKDSENLKQQIKSLIKHHSLSNLSNFNSYFSNIKFINNSKAEKKIKKKKNIFNNILNQNIRDNKNNDIFPWNKNEKLHFNTNYSVLLNNNSKKDNNSIKYCAKIKNFKNFFNIYNSRPLTLNFSNEFNNFNSYKMLLNNNQSMKYLNKYKPNYRKKISPKESLSKSKKKGKSEEKDSKRKLILIDNKKANNSKSFNIMFTQKNDRLYYSTSFTPIHKIYPKKKETSKNIKKNIRQLNNNNKSSMRINNSIDRVQINLNIKNNNSNINNKTSEKKNASVKTSENKINIKCFNKIEPKGKNCKNLNKNINNKKGVIISQKTSPLYSKKLYKKIKFNTKNKNKIQYNIVVDYNTYDKNNNNTFKKPNKKKVINEENIKITPEQNHFLAVEQIQQIKKTNNIFG